jgi:hypothetical protein
MSVGESLGNHMNHRFTKYTHRIYLASKNKYYSSWKTVKLSFQYKMKTTNWHFIQFTAEATVPFNASQQV